MTDEELIARLREEDTIWCDDIAHAAADRIEALVKVRREDALELIAAHGQAHDAYEAQLKAEARAERLEAALRIIGGNNCITCSAVAFNALFAERHPSAALTQKEPTDG